MTESNCSEHGLGAEVHASTSVPASTPPPGAPPADAVAAWLDGLLWSARCLILEMDGVEAERLVAAAQGDRAIVVAGATGERLAVGARLESFSDLNVWTLDLAPAADADGALVGPDDPQMRALAAELGREIYLVTRAL